MLSLFGTESWSEYGQVVLQMAMLDTLLSIEQLLQRIAVKVVRMTDRPATMDELLDPYPRCLTNRPKETSHQKVSASCQGYSLSRVQVRRCVPEALDELTSGGLAETRGQ